MSYGEKRVSCPRRNVAGIVPGHRAETNRRGKELKFQRRKPSAGICSLESRELHVIFVFLNAIEVEPLPGKIYTTLSFSATAALQEALGSSKPFRPGVSLSKMFEAVIYSLLKENSNPS